MKKVLQFIVLLMGVLMLPAAAWGYALLSSSFLNIRFPGGLARAVL